MRVPDRTARPLLVSRSVIRADWHLGEGPITVKAYPILDQRCSAGYVVPICLRNIK